MYVCMIKRELERWEKDIFLGATFSAQKHEGSHLKKIFFPKFQS